MGAERKSAVIAEKEKLMTAYHEVGAAFLKGLTLIYVTLLGRPCASGTVHRRFYAAAQSHLCTTRPCSWNREYFLP